MNVRSSIFDQGDRSQYLLPALMMLAMVAFLSLDPLGFATAARNWVFDASQHFTSRAAPSGASPVRLVEVDRESLTRLGAWPWPRTRYAELATLAGQSGASVVLLDDTMETPDPTSPVSVARHTGGSTGGRNGITDHDALLGETLSGTKSIVPLRAGPESAAVEQDPATLGAAHNVEQSKAALAFLPRVGIMATPHGAVAEGARGLAFDAVGAAGGPFVSGLPLIAQSKGQILTSDILETLRLRTGVDSVGVSVSGGPNDLALFSRQGLFNVKLGDYPIPVAPDGTLRLFTREAAGLTRIPAWRVLEDPEARAGLDGNVVVISATADPAIRRYQVPGGARLTPGEIKAMALEQILTGSFLVRPGWALISEQIGFVAVAAAMIALMMVGMSGTAVIFAGVMSVIFLFTGWIAFSQNQILLDGALPAIGLMLMAMSVSWQRISAIASHTRHVLSAVGGKLPTPAKSTLKRRKVSKVLSGELRKITVLFCDIRDFTRFSELHRDDPEWMTELLKRFHDYVAETVKATGGVADTHQGTAVMGFWNAPADDPEHARKACDCALKLIEGLDQFNRELELEAETRSRGFKTIHFAIGINTGHALVGNLGSDRQVDYSALGDPVSIARKLMTYSEIYGPAIIVGEHTQNAVKSRYALLEIDRVGLRGSQLAVNTYALLGNPVVRANPHFRVLEEAQQHILEAYRGRNWSLARIRVQQTREMRSAITELYDFYEQRIAFYERNAPAPDWDGTFRSPVE